jgi:hypothetical protein
MVRSYRCTGVQCPRKGVGRACRQVSGGGEGDLCRQGEGDLVIDHDDDLEALAVRGDQTFEASLGHDGRSSLIDRVVGPFLEDEELAPGYDGVLVGQSHPFAQFAQEFIGLHVERILPE